MPLGKVLEAVANAGLFRNGVMLVGTAAYQAYPCLVGAFLPSSALMTNDADLFVSSFVSDDEPEDLEKILQRANPTFKALLSREDRLPKVFRSSDNFQVDIVTKFRRGRQSPIIIDELRCSAEALKFMEYLTEERMDAVALYGTGVLVSIPIPVRYAIHKLLIAQERRANAPKRNKDLKQAKDLIDVFLETDSAEFEDELRDARKRGPAWKKYRRIVGRDQKAGAPGLSFSFSEKEMRIDHDLREDRAFFDLLTGSYARLLGAPLVPAGATPEWLYAEAPFVVLAHNTDSDPLFVYANRAAQSCFEYDWSEFAGLPSRLSAEAPNREERTAILEKVSRHGFVRDYSGVRISKSGRRFLIEDGIVWQLIDEAGVSHGQAATFCCWRDVPEDAPPQAKS